jgi:hypothetical protein
MRAEELKLLLRKRPFAPLRIHRSDGQSFDIRHPDNVIVLQQRVDIGVGGDPKTGVAESVEYLSLLHVVRIEELPTTPAATPGGNGAG